MAEKTTEEYDSILTREYLIKNYVDNQTPEYKIAKEIGCDASTVRSRLLKYNLSVRVNKKSLPSEELEEKLNETFLQEYYLDKKLTTYQIAKIVGCDFSTVISRLRKHDISVRSKSEAFKSEKWKETHTIPRSEETKKKISEALKGEKHYNWKGGITPLNVNIYNLPEYNKWATDIFIRDNYTCQECGKTRGCGKAVLLEAHHIKPFCELRDEFLALYSQFSPIEDKETLIRLAISHKPFWDINNGKTLCYDCHGLTYKKVKREGELN